MFERGQPEFAFYLAGADPWEGDRLGRLALSKQGLRARDELVLDRLMDTRAPICVVLAGGYAEDYPGNECPSPMLIPTADQPPPPPPHVAYPSVFVLDPKTGKSVRRQAQKSSEWIWWVGLAVAAAALAPVVFGSGKR